MKLKSNPGPDAAYLPHESGFLAPAGPPNETVRLLPQLPLTYLLEKLLFFTNLLLHLHFQRLYQLTEPGSRKHESHQNTLLRIFCQTFLIKQDQWNKHNNSFTEQSCSNSTLGTESNRIEILSLACPEKPLTHSCAFWESVWTYKPQSLGLSS